MKKTIAVITAIVTMAATAAWALDLQTARFAGTVGETQTGYVQALSSNADVVKLVEEVNAARKAEYSKISAQNGQPVDVVAKIASGKIIANLPKGTQYRDADGSWKRK